jgi:glyoxylase-like metal-dependent hydrolase (beta-lactamase superfamily II)
MIDIPPYSESLANEIKYFMDPNFNKTEVGASPMKGKLDAILVTNQQSIHYDQSPGVYVTRKSDLEKWKKAFPDVKVIIYRIDQPRDCRESVTQVLDGYGPWGWDETSDVGFVQTGRPLQIEEWDKTTASNVLKLGETPPDDKDDDATDAREGNDDGMYSKEAIREREKNHDLLAVYTPGHTFGSITFVFPNRGICCSGYALPLESASADGFVDIEDEETYPSAAVALQGPRLDYQGYIASSVSRPRQMSSASKLINDYIDRFKIVLPARGDVVFLDNDVDTRKRELMENVGLYAKISEIYGRLGIAE